MNFSVAVVCQALMIGTSGINVANCYKQYGGTVDAIKVHRILAAFAFGLYLCVQPFRLINPKEPHVLSHTQHIY